MLCVIPRLMSKGASLALDIGMYLSLSKLYNNNPSSSCRCSFPSSHRRYSLALQRARVFKPLSHPSRLTLPRAPMLCTLADALKAKQTEYYTNTRSLLPLLPSTAHLVPNPVFRNYQTHSSYFPRSVSLWFLFLQKESSCFTRIPSRGTVNEDRQMDETKG